MSHTTVGQFNFPISIEEFVFLFWSGAYWSHFDLNVMKEEALTLSLWERCEESKDLMRNKRCNHMLPIQLPWLPLFVSANSVQRIKDFDIVACQSLSNDYNNDNGNGMTRNGAGIVKDKQKKREITLTERTEISGVPWVEPIVIIDWRIKEHNYHPLNHDNHDNHHADHLNHHVNHPRNHDNHHVDSEIDGNGNIVAGISGEVTISFAYKSYSWLQGAVEMNSISELTSYMQKWIPMAEFFIQLYRQQHRQPGDIQGHHPYRDGVDIDLINDNQRMFLSSIFSEDCIMKLKNKKVKDMVSRDSSSASDDGIIEHKKEVIAASNQMDLSFKQPPIVHPVAFSGTAIKLTSTSSLISSKASDQPPPPHNPTLIPPPRSEVEKRKATERMNVKSKPASGSNVAANPKGILSEFEHKVKPITPERQVEILLQLSDSDYYLSGLILVLAIAVNPIDYNDDSIGRCILLFQSLLWAYLFQLVLQWSNCSANQYVVRSSIPSLQLDSADLIHHHGTEAVLDPLKDAAFDIDTPITIDSDSEAGSIKEFTGDESDHDDDNFRHKQVIQPIAVDTASATDDTEAGAIQCGSSTVSDLSDIYTQSDESSDLDNEHEVTDLDFDIDVTTQQTGADLPVKLDDAFAWRTPPTTPGKPSIQTNQAENNIASAAQEKSFAAETEIQAESHNKSGILQRSLEGLEGGVGTMLSASAATAAAVVSPLSPIVTAVPALLHTMSFQLFSPAAPASPAPSLDSFDNFESIAVDDIDLPNPPKT